MQITCCKNVIVLEDFSLINSASFYISWNYIHDIIKFDFIDNLFAILL